MQNNTIKKSKMVLAVKTNNVPEICRGELMRMAPTWFDITIPFQNAVRQIAVTIPTYQSDLIQGVIKAYRLIPKLDLFDLSELMEYPVSLVAAIGG